MDHRPPSLGHLSAVQLFGAPLPGDGAAAGGERDQPGAAGATMLGRSWVAGWLGGWVVERFGGLGVGWVTPDRGTHSDSGPVDSR